MALRNQLMVLVWLLYSGVCWAGARAHVLCYHTFLGKPSIETDFSLAEFSQHINSLVQAGYTFVSLDQVNAAQVSGSKNLLVMFDDGHRSAYTAYLEVMEPLGLPAVFAIFPGTINSKFAMNWDQVRELASKPGNAIVAHGYWHEKLFDSFAEQHPRLFLQEFERSKQMIEEKLGVSVQTFVYPYGVISESAQKQLRSSGYTYAYGLAQKPLAIPLSENPDLLALPRWMVTRPFVGTIMKRLVPHPGKETTLGKNK